MHTICLNIHRIWILHAQLLTDFSMAVRINVEYIQIHSRIIWLVFVHVRVFYLFFK